MVFKDSADRDNINKDSLDVTKKDASNRSSELNTGRSSKLVEVECLDSTSYLKHNFSVVQNGQPQSKFNANMAIPSEFSILSQNRVALNTISPMKGQMMKTFDDKDTELLQYIGSSIVKMDHIIEKTMLG